MPTSTYYIQLGLDAVTANVAGLPTFKQEGQVATQKGTTPFCRSTLLPAKSTVAALGANPLWQQQGLYQVDLFYPVAYGYQAMRQMADSVIAAFPTGLIQLTDENQSQLQVIVAYSVPGLPDEGTFIQIPVRVEWRIIS